MVIADFTGNPTTSTALTIPTGCTVQFGIANYTVSTPQYTVAASPTGAVENAGGTQATITTTAANGYVANQMVTISGVTNAAFNGVFAIISVSGNSFVVANTVAVANATSGAGKAQQPALTVNQGSSLLCAGSNTDNVATIFTAASGFAADVIDGAANDLGTNSNDSWHNGTIKNCQVYGTNLEQRAMPRISSPAKLTSSSRTSLRTPHRTAFTSPETWQDRSFHRQQRFQFKRMRFRLYNVYSSFHASGIGGDNNVHAVCITPVTGEGTVVIGLDKLKIESASGSYNNPAITINGVNAIVTLILRDLIASGVSATDFIQYEATGDNDASITIQNGSITGWTNIFNNLQNSVAYPLANVTNQSNVVQEWTWSGVGMPTFHDYALYSDTQAAVNGLNSNLCLGGRSSPAGFLRLTGPTGAFSLGGFATSCLVGYTTIPGRTLTVFNSTSQTMTIVNEDSSSTAGFRIKTGTGANVVCPASSLSSAQFIYSGTDSRWVLLGGSCATSGTVSSVSVTTANGVWARSQPRQRRQPSV